MARASLQEIIIATNATETNVSQYLEKERSFRRYGRLTESLEAASHGIETHKVTYKNDDRFCSLVDVRSFTREAAPLRHVLTFR